MKRFLFLVICLFPLVAYSHGPPPAPPTAGGGTDTGPIPDCSGTTTYQDGEGNCDDISATYASISLMNPYPTSCSNGDVVGTNCGVGLNFRYWPVIEVSGGGTIELPAVSAGGLCVKSTTANALNIDPNSSDRFVLDGVSLDDGDKLTSDGSIDATICFYADSANGWRTVQNPGGAWSDGGA